MDGRTDERDGFDETHNRRFGQVPDPGEAYDDEARPDMGVGGLPQRIPADPTAARWEDAEPAQPGPLAWGEPPSASRWSQSSWTPSGDSAPAWPVSPASTWDDAAGSAEAEPSSAFDRLGIGARGGAEPDALPQRSGFDRMGGPSGAQSTVPRPAESAPLSGPEPDRESRGTAVAVRPSSRVARRRASSDEDGDEKPVRARRSMPLWQELPLLLVVAFCLAVLIRTFLLQAFFIPSGSMEQTLLVGDRVLVNKIVYDVRQPQRGEIVVFRGPDNWDPENFSEEPTSFLGRIGRTLGDLVGVSRPGEKDFIKRVIGLPGDRVSCCDPSGRVYVNGKGIDEPYVLNNSPLDVPPNPQSCRSRRFDEVLVPPGQIFVMGDHRIVSQDARCQGPVPIENVIGRAFVIVWPSNHWDTLNVPETFSDVPPPVALGPPGSTSIDRPIAPVGAAVVTLPILASLVVTTRWGRKPRWGRRTLRR
jgi:signal peptidase I